MGILRFRNAGKIEILFSKIYLSFVRNVNEVKNVQIPYSNGSGQEVLTNEILYSYLNPTDDGYIEIKSLSNQYLQGSGLLELQITHKPSSIQSDQDINFIYDYSSINIQFSYNSKPISTEISFYIDNRSYYTFIVDDFINNYSDYDLDSIKAISITGNVDGYTFNGSPYIEGQWIALDDVATGNLRYKSLDDDAYYEKINTWQASDIYNNYSNISNLTIKVKEYVPITCTPPVLDIINRQPGTLLFDLYWNYSGIDYSVVDVTTYIEVYISNDGVTYELYPGYIPYNINSYTVNLTSKAWEIFYFKIRLINTNCDVYSNIININI